MIAPVEPSPEVLIRSKVTTAGPSRVPTSTPWALGPVVLTLVRSRVTLSPCALTPSASAPTVEIVPSEVKIRSSAARSNAPVAPSPRVVMLVTWAVRLRPDVAVRPGPTLLIVDVPCETMSMSAAPIVPTVTGPLET